MSGGDLSAPLGALPPMKIHCAQLVEGALRSALTGEAPKAAAPAAATLVESFTAPANAGRKVKVVLKPAPPVG
jgi:nitrogen fixation NifU-like protein